jgi:hypothetical protein
MEWISLAPAYKIKPATPATPAPAPATPTSPVKTAAHKLPAASAAPPSPAKPPQPTSVNPFAAANAAAAVEDKRIAEEKQAAADRLTQATTARLSALSLSKDSPAASTRADSPTSTVFAGAAQKVGPVGSIGNPYGALREDELRAESPPSSPRACTPASPVVRQLAKASASQHDGFNSSPARKYALNKALEDNPDPMAALKLFQPLIQLLSTLPARPPPLRYIVSALLRASHPSIYDAYGWKSFVARAEDEGIVDLGDGPARTGKGRKEWISLRDRYRESKHEMIVVESTDGGKVPPYADKTAELFDPLIKALSKLPPARCVVASALFGRSLRVPNELMPLSPPVAPLFPARPTRPRQRTSRR